MKRATSRRTVGPSAASLREMPEVDFTKYRVHRNPYATVIAKEGLSLVHDEPSARSLADIPEIDFSQVTARRNPYASRAKTAVMQLKAGRGRPKKGHEIGPTPARSVRLPMTVWAALEEAARGANTTVHALLRLAVTHLLETTPALQNRGGGSSRRARSRLASKAQAAPMFKRSRVRPRRRAVRARRRS
jgi:hypothetical protein